MDTTPTNNGDAVTAEQIVALSKHFFDNAYVMDKGAIRKMDATKDTKSMCFDKSKIDALFASFPDADKLTVHLGMHSTSILPPGDPRYEDKMMVVLEAKSSTGAASPTGGAVAMDFAYLCPPHSDC